MSRRSPASMLTIPGRLAAMCRQSRERCTWLERLPQSIRELTERWTLSLEDPFEASCAWVAPAARSDGTRVVLKLGMPHMEGEQEIEGLRFWKGEGVARLLDADVVLNAMLLERCEPGTTLRKVSEPEQDGIVADVLRRLWRVPPAPHAFRPLSTMLGHWASETLEAAHSWPDPGLVRAGLHLFQELPRESADDVLLATDLHAGNILRAKRQPWLAIDPKPFIGDRAFDATQHLLNCSDRLLAAPDATIRRFADLLEVDDHRVRLWTFARAAAGPRDVWAEESFALARALA